MGAGAEAGGAGTCECDGAYWCSGGDATRGAACGVSAGCGFTMIGRSGGA